MGTFGTSHLPCDSREKNKQTQPLPRSQNSLFDLRIPFSISEFPYKCGNKLRVFIFSQGKWELLGVPIYLVILEKKNKQTQLLARSQNSLFDFPFRCGNRLRVLIFSQGKWELLGLPIYLVILEKKNKQTQPSPRSQNFLLDAETD